MKVNLSILGVSGLLAAVTLASGCGNKESKTDSPAPAKPTQKTAMPQTSAQANEAIQEAPEGSSVNLSKFASLSNRVIKKDESTKSHFDIILSYDKTISIIHVLNKGVHKPIEGKLSYNQVNLGLDELYAEKIRQKKQTIPPYFVQKSKKIFEKVILNAYDCVNSSKHTEFDVSMCENKEAKALKASLKEAFDHDEKAFKSLRIKQFFKKANSGLQSFELGDNDLHIALHDITCMKKTDLCLISHVPEVKKEK